MVVMNRQDYINKVQGALYDKDTYRPIYKDPNSKLKNQLIHILKNCKSQGKVNQIKHERIYPTCEIPAKMLWVTKNP